MPNINSQLRTQGLGKHPLDVSMEPWAHCKLEVIQDTAFYLTSTSPHTYRGRLFWIFR